MNRAWAFLGGLAAGGTLIYLLDPERGSGRRRALLGEQGVVVSHRVQDFLSKAGHDVGDRIRGMFSKGRSGFLEQHDRAENIAALQDGPPPSGRSAEWSQENWTPMLQLLAGIAGITAIAYGMRTLLISSGREHDLVPQR